MFALLSVVVNLGTCVLMTSSGTRQQSLARGVATTSILMGGHFYKWGVFSVSMHLYASITRITIYPKRVGQGIKVCPLLDNGQ